MLVWIWCAWQTGLLFPTVCSAPATGLWELSYNHVRIPVHSAGWVGIWSSLPFAWSFTCLVIYITCFDQWAWTVMTPAVIKGKLWMWLSAVFQPPSLSCTVFYHEIWMVQLLAVWFILMSENGGQVKLSPAQSIWTQPTWTTLLSLCEQETNTLIIQLWDLVVGCYCNKRDDRHRMPVPHSQYTVKSTLKFIMNPNLVSSETRIHVRIYDAQFKALNHILKSEKPFGNHKGELI